MRKNNFILISFILGRNYLIKIIIIKIILREYYIYYKF